MKVVIHKLYTDDSIVLDGDPVKLKERLMVELPWLAEYPSDLSLDELLDVVAQSQAYDVEKEDGLEADVKPEVPMVKNESNFIGNEDDDAFEAVRFMTNSQPISHDIARRSLWDMDGDAKKAALVAYGEEPTENNIKAVSAWIDISNRAPEAKVREEVPSMAVTAKAPEDGDPAAEAIRRAFNAHKVFTAQLGGKHSKGSMLATDPEANKTYLLKPGSNGQSIAAGVIDSSATQAEREAAFWSVASLWDLGQYFPRADLLMIGEQEMACIEMLPRPYRLLEDLDEKNPGMAQRLLRQYLGQGTLHHWAVIDYVLGNPDRHGRNMMANPSDGVVRLIDQGSAFAGKGFNPAHDRYSFVPFYLRVWGPPVFNKLTSQDKLRNMPRLSRDQVEALHVWIVGLDADRTSKAITRYGVDPHPSLDRLIGLKGMIETFPADLAVNKIWVEGLPV